MSDKWINMTDNYPSTYGLLSRVITCNYATLNTLGNKLVDPGFWDSITKLNDISTYIERILIYPMFIRVPQATEIKGLRFMGAIDSFYSDINVTNFDTYSEENTFLVFNDRIDPKYNDFRDYGNYTKIRMWLPFVGYTDLSTNDVMGKQVKVVLKVDYRTGMGLYYILVKDVDSDTDLITEYRILSKHSAKIAIEVPVASTSSAEQYRNMVLSALKVATTVGFAAAGMPVSATVMASNLVTTTENFSEAKARGNYPGARMRTVSSTRDTGVTEESGTKTYTHMRGSFAIANDVFSSAISAINGSSASIASVETNDAVLEGAGSKYVTLVIERPVYGEVGNYYNLCGRPLQKVKALNTLTGYTEISDLHLENFGEATQTEIATLNSLLKTGIIL